MKWFLYSMCCILDNRLGDKLFCRFFHLWSIHFIHNMLLCLGYIWYSLWMNIMIWFNNRFLISWFDLIFMMFLFYKLCSSMLRFNYSLFCCNTYFICGLDLTEASSFLSTSLLRVWMDCCLIKCWIFLFVSFVLIACIFCFVLISLKFVNSFVCKKAESKFCLVE